MVCIGPRKGNQFQQTRQALAMSPLEVVLEIINNTNTSGATTKRASKLKPPNKVAHTTNTTTITTTTSKRSTTTPRKTVSPRPSADSRLSKQRTSRTSMNSQHPISPDPISRRLLSPRASPRQSMVSARKSTPATKITQPRNTTAPSIKKSPVAQMRQDFDILKSKYDANEQVIAQQQAELELLKQQLANISPLSTPVPRALLDQSTPPTSLSNTSVDLQQTQVLQEKDQALAGLGRKLEQVTKNMAAATGDSIALETSMDDNSTFGDKNGIAHGVTEEECLLKEKGHDFAVQLQHMEQEQQRLALEEVASQMNELELENKEAIRQLTIKEKELDELRTSIPDDTDTSPSNSNIISTTEEQSDTLLKLQQQLNEQKRIHEESLRQHELVINEKERMLKEQEETLELLKSTHDENVHYLKAQQTSNILKMKQKHKQDMLELQQKMDQVEQFKQQQGDQAKRQQEQLDGELEKILHAFEQAEHNHTAQLQTMEHSHQSAISDLQQSHVNQLKTIGASQGYTSTKYVPYEAVSWPAPQPLSMLRKTSGPSPRPDRVLLNAFASSSEPILTPLDTKKVQVYISTISGNPVIKKNQEHIQQILKSRHIIFELVDVAANEMALQYMKRNNNSGLLDGRAKEVPQLFVGGEFRGLFNDVVKHDEEGTLETLLIPAAKRNWTTVERQAIEKATIGSSSLSSSSLNNTPHPPIRVLPHGPVITTALRKTATTTTCALDNEDEALLKELEQEFSQGNVDLSQLDQI
ncbi:unnamed protein product [Absidia cylindrospora]